MYDSLSTSEPCAQRISQSFSPLCSTITELPAGPHRQTAPQESAAASAQACGPAHLLFGGETLAGHLRSSEENGVCVASP